MGSARPAGSLSHASKLSSYVAFCFYTHCYVLLVSGLDHVVTLLEVVVVDIDSYIENQRQS